MFRRPSQKALFCSSQPLHEASENPPLAGQRMRWIEIMCLTCKSVTCTSCSTGVQREGTATVTMPSPPASFARRCHVAASGSSALAGAGG